MTDKYLETGAGARRAPAETFQRLLKLVHQHKVDALVLGGDVVNFPHNASVQFARAAVANECGPNGNRVPMLFTAGNHDWLVEGLGGRRDEMRSRFRREILRPLYRFNPSRRRLAGRNRVPETEDYDVLELPFRHRARP